jgi:D-alanyl-D-alanine carboxypeptidase
MQLRSLSLLFSAALAVLASAAKAEDAIRLSMDRTRAVSVSATPGIDAATPFAIASVGKTMTAVAVLRLVERGALSLDDPLTDLLPPRLTGPIRGIEAVRLHHLLTMTSGLPDYYTDDWLEAALANPGQVQSVTGAMRFAAQDAMLFAPGRRFDYSNTNYVLLQAVLEQATGKTYPAILQAEVFGPAGMTDSFVFGSRPLPETFAAGHDERALVRRYYAGNGLGDGGVIASARDVARFYRALFVERRLLSDQMLAVMLQDPSGADYGMGVETESGIAGHSGGDLGFASDARIDLARGLIAVELVGAEDADTDWAWDRVSQ